MPAPASSDISPAWLVRALAIAVGSAVILAYCAVCLLVFLGARQFILHPSRTVGQTPSAVGVPFEAVSFDAAATGSPRLTGWWIPALSPAVPTILILHDGQGSLSATLPLLALLHKAAVNILAIDYRGFGLSDPTHPTEAYMAEDAAAALTYLTETRHIPVNTIIPYGTGLGAALAARLAAANPELPAVIIDNPDLHTVAAVQGDPRAGLLPMRLLLRDRFDLASPLMTVHQPRLLLVGGPSDVSPQFDRANTAFFKSLPDPKWTAELLPPAPSLPPPDPQHPCPGCPGPAYLTTIVRFLDTYVSPPPAVLKLNAQPAKDHP